MSYGDVASHRSMALDTVRNSAYARALGEVIRPDSIVLDLGAGTGILGAIAARLGAHHVYLVEPEDIIQLAEQIVVANGLQDRVTCIRGRIEDVRLPEPASVIVSVLTGNFLVAEDFLPALFHARDTMLAPGGVLIPRAASMNVAPVSAPSLHGSHVAGWSTVQSGIDIGTVRPYAVNSIYWEPEALRAAQPLAPAQSLLTIDFRRDVYRPVHATAGFDVTTDGLCHGWAGWADMDLNGAWLSTSPFAPPVHWSSAFLPLDPPVPVTAGQTLTLEVHRAPRGDWTWTTRAPAGTQQHSTLLGLPLTLETIRKASVKYTPALTDDGRDVLEVLSRCDGATSVETIAHWLHEAHPARWPPAEALAFVQRTIKKYS